MSSSYSILRVKLSDSIWQGSSMLLLRWQKVRDVLQREHFHVRHTSRYFISVTACDILEPYLHPFSRDSMSLVTCIGFWKAFTLQHLWLLVTCSLCGSLPHCYLQSCLQSFHVWLQKQPNNKKAALASSWSSPGYILYLFDHISVQFCITTCPRLALGLVLLEEQTVARNWNPI